MPLLAPQPPLPLPLLAVFTLLAPATTEVCDSPAMILMFALASYLNKLSVSNPAAPTRLPNTPFLLLGLVVKLIILCVSSSSKPVN